MNFLTLDPLLVKNESSTKLNGTLRGEGSVLQEIRVNIGAYP